MIFIRTLKGALCLINLLWAISIYSQKNIVLHLDYKSDTIPIDFGRTLGRPVDSSLEFKTKGLSFVKYIIREIPIEFNQRLRKSDKASFQSAFYYLIGLDSANEIHVIPDLNWNRNFADDKQFVYPAIPGQLLYDTFKRSLPIFGTEVSTPYGLVPINFRIVPRWLFPSLTLSSPDRFFDSVAVAFENTSYRTGRFDFMDQKFYVYADNLFLAASYNSSEAGILLADTPIVKKITSFRSYSHIGDTIDYKGVLIIFQGLSVIGDSLYVRAMPLPRDFYMENIKVLDKRTIVQGKGKFDIRTVSGKYVLLDFWGTWCVPCMELTDSIKLLYEQIIVPNKEKVSLVSISADNSIDQVNSSLIKHNIEWVNIFQSLKDTAAPVIKHFHVSSYPLFVLIDPKGKIIESGEGSIGFFTIRKALEKLFSFQK